MAIVKELCSLKCSFKNHKEIAQITLELIFRFWSWVLISLIHRKLRYNVRQWTCRVNRGTLTYLVRLLTVSNSCSLHLAHCEHQYKDLLYLKTNLQQLSETNATCLRYFNHQYWFASTYSSPTEMLHMVPIRDCTEFAANCPQKIHLIFTYMLCKGEEKQPIRRRVIISTTPGKFLMRSVSKSFIDCYLTISSALKKPGQRKNKIQNAQRFLRFTRNTHALHTRKSEELPKGAKSTEKCFVLFLSYSKYAKFPKQYILTSAY